MDRAGQGAETGLNAHEQTLDASLPVGDPGRTDPGGDEFPIASWDRYEFMAVLGHGGMGSVYRARDRLLGRDVALKFIRGGDHELTLRLLREARAQARVDHPNICKVFEVGEVAGKAYIAMELVAGRPLQDVSADMSVQDKALVVRDAALALHEAHALGILHRDIKPGNILVERAEDGRWRPVVMDFGIARDASAEHLTETGALLGTPAYMSPEQARGDWRAVDRRSDVYSLGATLYELLAGAPPFRGDTPMSVVLAVLSEEPAPLRARIASIPADLETIVGKCLVKEPGQRYDSARALAEDLDRHLRGEPILGRREGLYRRLRRKAHRHRALVAVSVLALLAVLAAAGYGITTRIAAQRQAAALAAEAQLGRELAQDAKEIEWLLRTAHLLPLHDTTPERAMVRARMDQVAARTVPAGIGAALVDYTVGRGHFSLRELDRAHERLGRALAGGLDTPELHYALGLVLGELYGEEVAEARRTEKGDQLKRRLAALEDEFLAPALASLGRAREAKVEAPSYLEGTIALYRREYDEAIALARRAREEAPWFYESLELEARAQRARSDRLADEGDAGAARAALEAAAQLHDAAAAVARSDASVYEAAAEAWTALMRGSLGPDFTPELHLPHIIESCERAAVARPDATSPFDRLAAAHFEIVAFYTQLGKDPHEFVQAIAAVTDRALAVDSDDFAALLWRARTRNEEARFAMFVGVDSRAHFDEANREAERLLAAYPEHARAITSFASARFARALSGTEHGEDPVKDIEEAIAALWAAAERSNDVTPMQKILQGYTLLATWLVRYGRDPGPPTARSEEALARCLALAPGDAFCRERFDQLLLWSADYALMSGGDPTPLLALVREHIDDASPPSVSTRCDMLEFERALRSGEDPGVTLARWSQEIEACKRRGGAEWQCVIAEVDYLLRLARAAAARGGSDRDALTRARSFLGDDTWGDKEILAEIELRLAALAGSPAERDRHLADGLAAAVRGLELHPDQPRLLALKAALHLLAAESRPETRGESLRLARAAMKRAREVHPWIHTEFATTVAALERAPE